MNEKTSFPEEVEVRHKKKSKAKGLPRADHKHLYETVLLTKIYNGTDFKTGKPRVTEHQIPTKVCTVCGRIDYVDKDQKYYIRKEVPNLPFRAYADELSAAALALPKWLAEDFFAKFAVKCEEV